MKVIFIVAFSLFISNICYAQDNKTTPTFQEEKQCSEEAKIIINKLTIKGWALDVSGLSVLDGKEADVVIKADYEKCTVPHPLANDMYIYTVIYDKDNKYFWIHKTGGYEGASVLYGPGLIDEFGNIVKELKK